MGQEASIGVIGTASLKRKDIAAKVDRFKSLMLASGLHSHFRSQMGLLFVTKFVFGDAQKF